MAIRLSAVAGFTKQEISQWAKKHISAGSQVITDGLSCFTGLQSEDYSHEVHIAGSGSSYWGATVFNWVNTVLGNVKNSIRGSYHAISEKHLPRYLAEFCYRFNRRCRLETLIPRFTYVALRTPPMPQHLLKLAEFRW